MKKIIRNKKFRIATFISFVTTVFLVGIFFSKVIFAPTDVAEAIIDGRELPESAYPNIARIISLVGRDINSEDDGIKSINDYEGTFCTGTLIGPRYVLTAAHCLVDDRRQMRSPLTFTDQIRIRLNGSDYQSKAFYIHPSYGVDVLPKEIDAAIIELSTNVKNITPATLNTAVIPLNANILFAGIGTLAYKDTHAEPVHVYDAEYTPLGKISVGENVLDGYGSYDASYTNLIPDPNYKGNYFYWKFSSCENTAHGDSGGPIFYGDKLIGITAYGQNSSTSGSCGLGSYSFNARVDKIIPWINGILSGKTKPTFLKLTKLDPICNNTPVDTFIFKKPIELSYSNKKDNYCIALGSHPNLVDTGRYDMKTAFGIYKNYSTDAPYILKPIVNATVLKIKKQGSPDYIGQLNRVLGSSEYTETTGYKGIPITLSKSENNSSELGEFYNPGGYTIEAWYNGEKISSDDICLESIASPAGNKIGNVICGDGVNSGVVISGSSPSDSDSITTTETITYTASGKQEFTASSERYPGITMNGSLTPTIEGSDLSIDGSFTYNYNTSAVSAITRGGTLSFHLVDGDGHTSQIIPVDVVAASEIPEYNKPYSFNPGFDNYIKFLDEDGKPVSAERKAPFSLVITDDGLGMRTAKIPVVDSVISGTMSGISMNGGMISDSSGTSVKASNGSQVTFTVTKSEFTPPGLLDANVTATYTKTTSGTDPIAKNITGTLYDNKGNKLIDVPADIYKNKPNTFDVSFVDVDPAKGPFTMTLKDDDLGVAVSGLKLATIDPKTLNNPDNPADPKDPKETTKSQYGLFQNPLRKGLDSIPEIVSALVKNIVIPIAVPFLALAIIYTGFLFIQARGNKDKLEKAKESLKWTLIGGAIILAAYVIATALQGTIADIIR